MTMSAPQLSAFSANERPDVGVERDPESMGSDRWYATMGDVSWDLFVMDLPEDASAQSPSGFFSPADAVTGCLAWRAYRDSVIK
jgi:hypothetical protein